MGVSKNYGTPKSSILIGFSTINHPLGYPDFWKHPYMGDFFLFGGGGYRDRLNCEDCSSIQSDTICRYM